MAAAVTPRSVLCFGATGDVGGRAVKHLLQQGHTVKAVVRDAARLPASVQGHERLSTVQCDDVTALGAQGTQELMRGCSAVVSCLGHRLTFKGMYQHPRKLCADVVSQVIEAAALREKAGEEPVRFVLLSTAGATNPDPASKEHSKRSFGELTVLKLLEWLLPPHWDNISALNRLTSTQQRPAFQWVAVRPDDFERESDVCPYQAFETLQNGLFNSGTTSTENIGHFMARLVGEQPLWDQWKGKCPQLLNVPAEQQGPAQPAQAKEQAQEAKPQPQAQAQAQAQPQGSSGAAA